MPAKEKRYNWKARQRKRGDEPAHRGSMPISNVLEDDPSCSDGRRVHAKHNDTNALVLPAKRKQRGSLERTHSHPKRRKLSSRQRKRLERIVEAKEKKSRRASLIESLQCLALPTAEMSLLHPATSLSRTRVTGQQVLERAKACSATHLGRKLTPWLNQESANDSVLAHTRWRRKSRKRRKLKMEKVLKGGKDEDNREEEDEEETSDKDEEEDKSLPSAEMSTNDAKEQSSSPNPGQWPRLLTETSCSSSSCHGLHAECKDRSSKDVPISQSECSSPVTTSNKASQQAVFLALDRTTEIQSSRLSLPILSEEQVIMEAIAEHDAVVVCGETGSGKTTQLPQFLYEAGYTLSDPSGSPSMIAVTEPRRVAAISMSQRVAKEMNLTSKEVSYQIRYEGNITAGTQIKFMTDGILLKELENDFLLSQYSVVVIDEAHERSVFTDILIGLLSRIVPLRCKNGNPLKLIIMSATLKVQDFTENKLLFPVPPPVIKVESRQYPVTVHFNKRTPTDYVMAAFVKICKIHRELPSGHILAFLTGRAEVLALCRKLRKAFPSSVRQWRNADDQSSHTHTHKPGKWKRRKRGAMKIAHLQLDLDNYPALPESSSDMPEWWEENEEVSGDQFISSSEEEEDKQGCSHSLDWQLPMLVLPMYSMLPVDQQAKVFASHPEGIRLCVVATNVAETSITIPGIKYVVDSGKVKKRLYDEVTGISMFHVSWTSKASANQRAGRAGRTEPGHCYRLFSSTVFHHEFHEFSEPEICQRPVEDLVLQMKALNIDKVANFPFPTPPSLPAIKAAEQLLLQLEALKCESERDQVGTPPVLHITSLGRTMAQFPVAPRYAKMLCLANQRDCLPYTIAIIAALSVKELFIFGDMAALVGNDDKNEDHHQQQDKLTAMKRSWAGQGESRLLGDLMVLLRAVGAYECSKDGREFCKSHGLREKAMIEIRKLRRQLTNTVKLVCPEASVCLDPKMPPPTEEQARFLRQIVLSGVGDQVARKIDVSGMNTDDKKRLRFAYQTCLCDDPAYIHSSSALRNMCPPFVVFQEITDSGKLCMRGVTAVEEKWLPVIVPQFCSFSPPLQDPPPLYDPTSGTVRCHMTCTFGARQWPLPLHVSAFPESLDKYKYFALFLLQGKVVPELSKYCPYLLSSPITMIKKWAKLHKRTQVLLTALVAKEVCTRDRLLSEWKEDSKFLLQAYCMWIPHSKHSELAFEWPPVTKTI